MDSKERDTLDEILEELRSQGNKDQGLFGKFARISPFLSTILIGSLGIYVTHTFNEQQGLRNQQAQEHRAKILEMQTLEKFLPHLKGDEKTKEIALLAIGDLGGAELATRMAKLFPSKGSDAATDKIMRTAFAPTQKQLPRPVKTVAKSEKEGWAYVGYYIEPDNNWETWYFNFSHDDKPKSLEGKTLSVREETGTLNVREGMPTDSGSFKNITDTLKPGSKVKILEVDEWYSSGYIWAHIAYGE